MHWWWCMYPNTSRPTPHTQQHPYLDGDDFEEGLGGVSEPLFSCRIDNAKVRRGWVGGWGRWGRREGRTMHDQKTDPR
jgi:hypothetical protein